MPVVGVPGGPGEEGTWDGVPACPLEVSTLTVKGTQHGETGKKQSVRYSK